MLLVFRKPLWASMMSEEDSRNKTVIYHSFHRLAYTTDQCYWAVIIWIFGVFYWLGKGCDGGFSPGSWKLPSSPNIVKNLKKALERSFWIEDALKSSNVIGLGQEMCHGL